MCTSCKSTIHSHLGKGLALQTRDYWQFTDLITENYIQLPGSVLYTGLQQGFYLSCSKGSGGKVWKLGSAYQDSVPITLCAWMQHNTGPPFATTCMRKARGVLDWEACCMFELLILLLGTIQQLCPLQICNSELRVEENREKQSCKGDKDKVNASWRTMKVLMVWLACSIQRTMTF